MSLWSRNNWCTVNHSMCDRTVAVFTARATVLLLHEPWELNTGNLQLSTAPDDILPRRFHVVMQSFPSQSGCPISRCSLCLCFQTDIQFSTAKLFKLSGKVSVRREDMHSLNVSLPPCPTFPSHHPRPHKSILPLSTSAVLYCEMDRQSSLAYLFMLSVGGWTKQMAFKNKKRTFRAYFDICLSVADQGGEVSICHEVPSDSQRERSLSHGPPAFVTETKSQTSFCLTDWSEHKTSSGLIMQRNTLFLFLFVQMLDFVKTWAMLNGILKRHH